MLWSQPPLQGLAFDMVWDVAVTRSCDHHFLLERIECEYWVFKLVLLSFLFRNLKLTRNLSGTVRYPARTIISRSNEMPPTKMKRFNFLCTWVISCVAILPTSARPLWSNMAKSTWMSLQIHSPFLFCGFKRIWTIIVCFIYPKANVSLIQMPGSCWVMQPINISLPKKRKRFWPMPWSEWPRLLPRSNWGQSVSGWLTLRKRWRWRGSAIYYSRRRIILVL